MKNILFLTISPFESLNMRSIYTDLMKVILEKGYNVYVLSPIERRYKKDTFLTNEGNLHLLRVRTGNIIKCSLIEKGITTLLIQDQYKKVISKYFSNVKFDMVLYSTPPITFDKIVKYLKTKHNCITYLMLKDIFPQNAVDICLIKENGLLHRYFRKKEKNLYNISDHIGCMSQGNVNYILKHNPWLDKSKVEVFPNAIIPIEKRENKTKNITLLDKYNIQHDAVIFIYGGNLGKPQGIDFLIDVIDNFHKVEKGYLLIVGSGTEYHRIEKHISSTKPKNIALYQYLPKDDYDKLLAQADIGLILLDKRFTIPNFPSRLLSYMENTMPIIATTDKATDIKDVLLDSQSGLWSESGDIDNFIKNVNKLTNDEQLRRIMGTNARKFLDDNYDVKKTVKILLEKFNPEHI